MWLLPQWAQCGGILAADGHLAAIVAVPDRDAVPPPQLAADAPILDVLQPVVIDLGEAFRHDLDAAIPHRCQGGFGQRLDLDEPLGGDHRLNDLTTALRARHVERVGFFLDHQPGRAHIRPDFLAAVKAVHARRTARRSR